jgi:hypothetical protein
MPTDRPALLAGDYAQIIRAQVEPNVIDPVVLAHSGSGPLLVNGHREGATGGRGGIRRWPRVSPLMAKQVPTRG